MISKQPNLFIYHLIRSAYSSFMHFAKVISICQFRLWDKKKYFEPQILQVVPLKKLREVCNVHHYYSLTVRDTMVRRTKYLIFTNKQDFWPSQTSCFFIRKLFYLPLKTCSNNTCLKLLYVEKTPVKLQTLHQGQHQIAIKGH